MRASPFVFASLFGAFLAVSIAREGTRLEAVAFAEPPPAAGAPAFIGPTADDMAPGAKPVDLRALPLPKGVERDWIRHDSEMLQTVRAALPPKGGSVTALFKATKAVGIESEDLAFGFKRHRAGLPDGGYGSCSFLAVSYAGSIASLRVSCHASLPSEHIATLRPIYETIYGPAFARTMTSNVAGVASDVEYQFPAVLAAGRAQLDRDLGAVASTSTAPVTPDLQHALDVLTSPLDRSAIGSHCGIVGQDPPARIAMNTLTAAKRVDLLRIALRSANPEGRAYAARGLTLLGSLASDDAAVVKKLEALPIALQTCGGCMFTEQSSTKVFSKVE